MTRNSLSRHTFGIARYRKAEAPALKARLEYAYFFFQAEDGIRDYKVTGVQTCALPILPQSLAKILVHAVFSTKDRRPFLRDHAMREELHRYLGGTLTHLDCQPIIVGGEIGRASCRERV